MDDQFAHLAEQRLVGNFWVQLHQRNEDGSKLRIFACELDCKGGKDQLEIPPVLKIPWTEERGSKLSIRENSGRDSPRNSRLSCPRHPIQPVDRRFVKVSGLKLNSVQNSPARPFEATIVIVMSILCLLTVDLVEDICFVCRGVVSGTLHRKVESSSDLFSVQRSVHLFGLERGTLTIDLRS